MNSWEYNESKHCGVDYADEKLVGGYDSRHRKFRNYESEFVAMIDFIAIDATEQKSIIDLGCGTGAMSILASKRFAKVYAVDISNAMISQARHKAENDKINNIEFINAGFLSYEHKNGPADMVMTKAAFHHLPDFWKQIALLRMNGMVKKGGILYLADVVFHFEPIEYRDKINRWVSAFEAKAGKDFREEVETHVRDEFSTFNWIVEGMLKKAGFSIEKSRTTDGFFTEYCCKKTGEVVFKS